MEISSPFAQPNSTPAPTPTPAATPTPTPQQMPKTAPAPSVAPAGGAATSSGSGMTLEALGKSVKSQFPTAKDSQGNAYNNYGDAFMGMIAASKDPTLKSQLSADQTARIPDNIDAHVKMYQEALKPQTPDAGAPEKSGPLTSGVLPQAAEGVDKSVLGTAAGAATMGMKIANAAGSLAGKIPVVGPAIQKFLTTDPNGAAAKSVTAATAAAQPSNTSQAVGKGIGDVAQFFVPGGAEADLAKGADDAIDAANIAKKLGLTGKAADTLNAALKVAAHGAVTGGSMAGVTGAQTGGDKGAMEESAVLGGVAGAAGKALEIAAPGITKALVKADFKLSPAQAAKAAEKADAAAQFETDNGIIGSTGAKMAKLGPLNDDLESTLQSAVPDLKVPTSDIVKNINDSVATLRKSEPAVYAAAKADAKEAISTLTGDGTKSISAEDALNGKRSWGARAFKNSRLSPKDAKVVSEGAYAVEQAYQGALSNSLDRVASAGTGAVKEGSGVIPIPAKLQSYFGGKSEVSLDEFNKVYSNAITSKNFNFVAQFKNDAGLMGRMFGIFAGRILGEAIMPGPAGEVIGMTAGELASTHAPGIARAALEHGVNVNPAAIPGAAKVTQGVINNN